MEPSLKTGDLVAGRYRIENVIGSGGMGVVYGATHVGLNQRVALKMLLPSAAMDSGVVARFLREARIAGQLTSEHSARVTDVGEDDDSPYLVMEYLLGSNLADVLKTRGPLPVREVVGWFLEACEGLAEAHSKGIVHRDIKPANLFLARRANGMSVLKVLDFGISKLLPSGFLDANEGALTNTETIMGSPRYMSPEQIRSAKHVDLRTDIWSLGVTLYEMIGGVLPFSGESSFELLVAIVSKQPEPLGSLRADLPPGFEQVVHRCLEKQPENRYQNTAELAAALAPFGPAEGAVMVSRIRAFSASTPPDLSPGASSPDLGLADTKELSSAPPQRPSLTTAAGTSLPLSSSEERPRGLPRPVLLGALGVAVAVGAWRLVPGASVEPAPSAPALAPPSASSIVPLASSVPASSTSAGAASSGGAVASTEPAPTASQGAPVVAASALPLSPSSLPSPARLPPKPPAVPSAKSAIHDETRK